MKIINLLNVLKPLRRNLSQQNSPKLYEDLLLKKGDAFVRSNAIKSYTGAEYLQTSRSMNDLISELSYPENFFKDLRSKKVLDVGTGRGELVLDMKELLGANAIGIDIAPTPVFEKYPELFVVADAADTKFPDWNFDRIFSSWSIFSFRQDSKNFQIKVLKELKRILKIDGKIRLGAVDVNYIQKIARKVRGLKPTEIEISRVNSGHGWVELTRMK